MTAVMRSMAGRMPSWVPTGEPAPGPTSEDRETAERQVARRPAEVLARLPQSPVSARGLEAIVTVAMFMRWTLRFGCLALLAGALVLPELIDACVRRPSGAASCRCSNHACCTSAASAASAACPLARSGQACARPRTVTRPGEPGRPGLRAGCGCHQGGEAGTLAQQKSTLPAGRLAGFAGPRDNGRHLPAQPVPVSSPTLAPEPPPPRAALRLA